MTRPTRADASAGPAGARRPVRRRSAGLTPVRAGAVLAMLLSAGGDLRPRRDARRSASSGSTSPGATITGDGGDPRPARASTTGTNLVRDRDGAARRRGCARSRPSPAPRSRSGCRTPSRVDIRERRPIVVWRGRRPALVRRRERPALRRGAATRRPTTLADLPVIIDDGAASRAFRGRLVARPGRPRRRPAARVADAGPGRQRAPGSARRRHRRERLHDQLGAARAGPRSSASTAAASGRRTSSRRRSCCSSSSSARPARTPSRRVILADATDGTYIPKADARPPSARRPVTRWPVRRPP